MADWRVRRATRRYIRKLSVIADLEIDDASKQAAARMAKREYDKTLEHYATSRDGM